MKRLAFTFALSFVCVSAVASAAPRDPVQERAIESAVSAVDPTLVPVLREANDAMDQNRARDAATAYARVHEKAPKVVDVTRRLCTAEARAGDVKSGVAHCREALAQDDAPENHAALATALLLTRPLMPADADEAYVEARNAVRLAPEREFAQSTLCEVAVRANDVQTLDTCSEKLRTIAPESPATHVFSAIAYERHDDYDAADREITEAQAKGFDPTAAKKMRDELALKRPKSETWKNVVLGVAVGWVATMFVLFVVGMMLSGASRSESRALRAMHRGVILASWASYYLSAIVLGAGMLALTAGLVIVFLSLTAPSLAVQAAIGVVVLYVVLASIRAMLARVSIDDDDEKLDLDEHPALRRALAGVTKALHMQKIEAVYARPDATFEIVERGGLLGHLRKKNGRALLVGVAALDGMSVRAFEALVATELGRFRIAKGGGDAAIVEANALDALADRMEARGVAVGSNPGWWFVRMFRWFFAGVAEGAIERQQRLADRWAAEAYGSAALTEALRHVVRRAAELDVRVETSLRSAIDGDGALPNLYEAKIDGVPEGLVETLKDLKEREELIAACDEAGRVESGEDDDAPAWSLFASREELERTMLERVSAALNERAGFALGDQASKPSTVARA